ncbi:hypothetical protein GM31_14665 [Trabulsiella odontotermitis]|uniref:Uncharacterized protein n=1 Tax=Trabulsiella odontotermitis TaxID=379893 RepID=A0A0L0H0F2_9ENTR|nr:hypothetical protein GM31_14665 [Trabulsiella odontotermitis]
MIEPFLFPQNTLFPVLCFFGVSLLILLSLYQIRRCVIFLNNNVFSFLFILLIVMLSVMQITVVFYDVTGYHWYGIEFIRSMGLARYISVQYGVLIFVVLQSSLVWRL